MKNKLAVMLCAVFLISCFVYYIDKKSENDTKMLVTDVDKPEEKPIETDKVDEKTDTVPEKPQSEPEKDEEKQKLELDGKIIVIDAGHGISNSNRQEAVAPGSKETKPAFAMGTRGKNLTEEELNLILALKLGEELEKTGAKVYLTRTGHETTMSNIERAEFANNLKADLSVKIHADGVASSSAHGASVLVPGNKYLSGNLVTESRRAGEFILREFVAETGAYDRGISVRNDITGFNWSKVPVVIIEVGFMTNPEEDSLLETVEYQNKMVSGMLNGIKNYFLKNQEDS